MGENTKIEWCDHTFSPVRGCQHAGPGCLHCYAEAMAKRNPKVLGKWGPNGTRVVAAESAWKQVKKWDTIAKITSPAGVNHLNRSVFCGSMCDVFEDWKGPIVNSKGVRISHVEGACEVVMTMSDVRARLFRLIDSTRLTWLLLTKRPENIRRFWPSIGFPNAGIPGALGRHVRFDNVYLGTSIACQEDADRNIPELLKCRDLCRGVFLSIEPLLGPVDLNKLEGPRNGLHGSALYRDHDDCFYSLNGAPIDQVIIGGESGPHARPCRPDWIRSIARQCEAAGVPCFVKQLGARPVQYVVTAVGQDEYGNVDDNGSFEVLKLRDKKGGDPAEWPEDLRQYRRLAWKGGA